MPKKAKTPDNTLSEEERKALIDGLSTDSQSIMNDDGGFLKTVLKNFFDKKDISMKTEYLNVSENYIGTKLQFMSEQLNMPYMGKFIEIFEIKRVSLERKGRKEILMLGKEMEQEDREQRMNQVRRMFGL